MDFETLYGRARSLPIIDWHNHLDMRMLAEDKPLGSLYEVWVKADPYKHRAMRICGEPERLITGDAPEPEKWAEENNDRRIKTERARQFESKSEEYNDLQKALRYCIKERLTQVALVGCEGLREDHFIANLSILVTYSRMLSLVMVTQEGVFNVLHQSATLPSRPGQQVSIFTKDEQLALTFHGLKYPVRHRAFQYLWEGSLNEALGEAFTIEIHGEGNVLVYRANPQD